MSKRLGEIQDSQAPPDSKKLKLDEPEEELDYFQDENCDYEEGNSDNEDDPWSMTPAIAQKQKAIVALHKENKKKVLLFTVKPKTIGQDLFAELVADDGLRYDNTHPFSDLMTNSPWMENDTSQKLRLKMVEILSKVSKHKDSVIYYPDAAVVAVINMHAT